MTSYKHLEEKVKVAAGKAGIDIREGDILDKLTNFAEYFAGDWFVRDMLAGLVEDLNGRERHRYRSMTLIPVNPSATEALNSYIHTKQQFDEVCGEFITKYGVKLENILKGEA